VPEYWQDTDIPWFTLADVWQLRDGKQVYLGETANTINEVGLANSAAELLPAGTVVLSRTASVGFSGIMPKPMATSQDFWNWVCGPQLLPEYLNYQFKSMGAVFKSLNMGSTHQTIYQKDAASLQIVVPSLYEQRAIADYLDRETARIDTLIEEQQRLIEMLRERRQTVIEHATATGGASPPSGWRAATLRRIGRFTTGTTPTGVPEDVFDADGQIGWARPEDLGGRVVPSRSLSALGAEQVRSTRDPVLVCCIGATVGKVGWAEGPISSNQQITAVEVDGSAKYWYYALMGSRSVLVALAVGNTIPILNNLRLGELEVVVPPITEQNKLASYLDEQTAKIDTLSAETERFIELARERRAALITAAVTGQVDVREMV
jgi:type I restriction enzyme S subunit